MAATETEPKTTELTPTVEVDGGPLSVRVDVVIFSIRPNEQGKPKLQILLVRRGVEPFAGYWALPGGFVAQQESLEEAARRKLVEETGLRPSYLEQLYTFGRPDRDPRGRIVSVAYYALVRTDDVQLAAGTSTAEAAWHSVAELPSDLAFDNNEIISYALWRLRSKLEYAHVAFQFLPPTFTLRQLREVYEIILGLEGKIDPSNFRRRVEESNTIVPTDQVVEGGRHRPPRLYRCTVQPNELYRGPRA